MLSLLLDILSVHQDPESITATILHRPKGEKSELNESAQKKRGKIYRELRKIHIEIQYSSPPPHI